MFNTVFNDLIVLFVFLLIGFVIREIVKPIQRLFIPASVLGGLVALILGPQCLGLVTLPETLGSMASPMIGIVCTCMILGTTITRGKLKSYAGTTNVECMVYFGQMGVGLLVGILLKKLWPALPEHWGILSVYAFFGGHGAASSAGQFYESAGLNGALDLGIILATLGLMLAMLVGMVIVNIGVRKGWAKAVSNDASDATLYGGVIPAEQQKPIGMGVVSGGGINSLALQLGLVFLCIFLGDKIFEPLGNVLPITKQFPAFLHGMVGAAIIWFLMLRTHTDKYLDRKSISTISGIALEICVTSAVATLNVGMVASFIVPILILTAVIVAFTVVACFFFGQRWLKKDWFETMCCIFGQSLGSATTGVALGRCVDPDGQTSCYDSFGIASSIFGPLAAVLVAIMPMLTMTSEWLVIVIGLGVAAVNIILGEFVLKKSKE